MKQVTSIRTVQGDTLDLICHRYYGRTAAVTEEVLELNPHLLEFGLIIPIDTLIELPTIASTPTRQLIQLWD